jgi:hypothetical protein
MKGEVFGNEFHEGFEHSFGNTTRIVVWLHVGHDQLDFSLEGYQLLFGLGELESKSCSGGLLEVAVRAFCSYRSVLFPTTPSTACEIHVSATWALFTGLVATASTMLFRIEVGSMQAID